MNHDETLPAAAEPGGTPPYPEVPELCFLKVDDDPLDEYLLEQEGRPPRLQPPSLENGGLIDRRF